MNLLEEVLKLSKSAKPLIKPMNYDDVVNEIKECATYGYYRHYFDIDKLSEETKEKLKNEGFEVVDLNQMSKTEVSWKE